MKKIAFVTALLCTVILLPIFSFSQDRGQAILIGQSFTMYSDVLGEERPFWVYVPETYSPKGNPVPVLYLLDGKGHFHHSTGVVSFLSRQGRIPPMMVVAIPNTKDRTYDLTPKIEKDMEARKYMPNAGGADDMLDFIQIELMPHIDTHYHTNAYKILVGHSLGGSFAVHTLINRPELFDAYISISPSMWWDKQILVEKADAFLDSIPNLDAYFYMTMGNEGGSMLGGAMKLAALFEEKSPKGFHWDFKVMKEETHGSIPHRSTYLGLEAIFKDWYRADLDSLYAEGGMEALNRHYARLSQTFGHEFEPSENDLNILGYRLMQVGKIDKAIEVFAENIKRHPNSYNVYDSMAEAYKVNGENKLAIKFYKKSLFIHPGNENGKNMLKDLGVEVDPMKDSANLDPHKLEKYMGMFEVTGFGSLELKLEKGKLLIKGNNEVPPQELVAFSGNRFVARPSGFLIIFEENEKGEIQGFEAQTGVGRYAYGEKIWPEIAQE